MGETHHIIVSSLIVLGSACFICFALDTNRIRAAWAKWVLLAVAVLGLGDGITGVLLNTGFLHLESDALWRCRAVLQAARGAIVGLVFALAVSGQLLGKRKDLRSDVTA
jgi:hypothetical protein